MTSQTSRSRPGGGGSTDPARSSATLPAASDSAAYGASTVRTRRTRTELDALDDVIVAEVAENAPMTLRGVYYRCVSVGAVDKTVTAYRAVGRRLLALRRNGRVPYSSITDGTRWITKPASWSDLDTMLDDAAASYRRQLWHDQGVEVHLYVEKDAISGVVLDVTSRFDVPLGVLRGYASESFAYTVAESVSWADRPVFMYQLGDHDPSGVDAWRDFQTKVTRLAPDAEVYFQRLAVTPDQIEELDLPTRPTKRNDTRAARFTGGSVEVDAIPAPYLRTIVADAIEGHIDPEALRLTRAVEASERGLLHQMIGATP